jgi:hypothetical protein
MRCGRRPPPPAPSAPWLAQLGRICRVRVLYVFRRSGGTPWILREHGGHWAGLGCPLAASSIENFRLAVGLLRGRTPGAVYDDRLRSRKTSPERMETTSTKGARTVETSSEGGIDLLAHVLALWIAQGPR